MPAGADGWLDGGIVPMYQRRQRRERNRPRNSVVSQSALRRRQSAAQPPRERSPGKIGRVATKRVGRLQGGGARASERRGRESGKRKRGKTFDIQCSSTPADEPPPGEWGEKRNNSRRASARASISVSEQERYVLCIRRRDRKQIPKAKTKAGVENRITTENNNRIE